jgi:6,7-dimethyl-8-ribityllumazine synthase
MTPPSLPAPLSGHGLRVAVLTAQWHGAITARLQAAALATLRAAGVEDDDVVVLEVPGAFELPQAAAWIARAGEADAVVALGCVVRGETPHFDFVASACAQGLQQVAIETGVPVGLGVITANTQAQAEARAGEATGKGGNKGVEAADAAVRMAALRRALEARRGSP